MATATANTHERMRAQSPMLTTSLMAPMVQKWVRWAVNPNNADSANTLVKTQSVREGRSISCMGADCIRCAAPRLRLAHVR